MRGTLIGLAVVAALAAGSLALGGGLEDVKKKDTLTILVSPGAPFVMHDGKDKLMGFDIELGEHLKKELGVKKLEWKEVAFEKLLADLASGQGDLALGGLSITEERKKTLEFSAPYKEVGKALLHRTGVADPATVLAAEGTTSVEAAKKAFPKATVRVVPNERAGAEEVLAGKADGLVSDTPFIRGFSKHHGGKVEWRDLPLLPNEPIAAAAAKGSESLLKAFDEMIAKIKKDGGYAKLEKEYFQDMGWIKKVKGD